MELLMGFVEWCYWALSAGLPLLWRAACIHWTGLLWALAGALAWMITKPMWGVLGRLCWTVFCFGYKWAGKSWIVEDKRRTKEDEGRKTTLKRKVG
ncbi:hypothetical protein DVH05_007439 [Phytophthora capsici]|nr:hypothetical protein DVH05_007439 [Phytophthora capsici]